MNYALFHSVRGFEAFEEMGFKRQRLEAEEPKSDRWYVYFPNGKYIFIDAWADVFMGKRNHPPFWVKVDGLEELSRLMMFVGDGEGMVSRSDWQGQMPHGWDEWGDVLYPVMMHGLRVV